jgi:hypothetical protein
MTSERRSPRSNGGPTSGRWLTSLSLVGGATELCFLLRKQRADRPHHRAACRSPVTSPAMMRSVPSLIDFRRRKSIDLRRSPPSWGKTRPSSFASAGRLLSALARGRPRSCMVRRCSSEGHTPRTGSLLRASDRFGAERIMSVHSSESLSLCSDGATSWAAFEKQRDENARRSRTCQPGHNPCRVP